MSNLVVSTELILFYFKCYVFAPSSSSFSGPFDTKEDAQEFYKEWLTKERDKRLRDPMKGAEEVGRNLAKTRKVKWLEKWPFSEQLLDLNCLAGIFYYI